MAIPAKVKSYLDKRGYSYKPIEHKTVFTAYDLAQTLKIDLGAVVKTLLITADRVPYLVALPANERLDFAKLAKALKAKKIAIAKEKDIATILKVHAGVQTPFGGFHGIGLVLDRALAKAKNAVFGCGSFTDSIQISLSQYGKLEQPLIAPIGERSSLKLQKKQKPKLRPKRKAKAKRAKLSRPKVKRTVKKHKR